MLIHLEKLGKSFGEKIVLHDVTASVEREDRIGIVGQNAQEKRPAEDPDRRIYGLRGWSSA